MLHDGCLPAQSPYSHPTPWAMWEPLDTILVSQWAVRGWHMTRSKCFRSRMDAAWLMVNPAHLHSWC